MKRVDWKNMSSANIKIKLNSMKNEHVAIKEKISKLTEELESIEKEYILGNNVINNRLQGKD